MIDEEAKKTHKKALYRIRSQRHEHAKNNKHIIQDEDKLINGELAERAAFIAREASHLALSIKNETEQRYRYHLRYDQIKLLEMAGALILAELERALRDLSKDPFIPDVKNNPPTERIIALINQNHIIPEEALERICEKTLPQKQEQPDDQS